MQTNASVKGVFSRWIGKVPLLRDPSAGLLLRNRFFLDILDWLDILDLHFQNFQNFQNIQII